MSATFSSSVRRSLLGYQALSIASVLALVVMVNYLAARHFQRWTVAGEGSEPLTEVSQRVLKSLTNRVDVVIFFDRDAPLFNLVYDLLREYNAVSPQVNIQVVDYLADPSKATEIKSRYQLDLARERNLVVFACQDRVRVVPESGLCDYDISAFLKGQSKEIRRSHFRGEQAFTSAILAVTDPRPVRVYYLQGHGEHRLDNPDKLMGYSRFAEVLRQSNVEVQELVLAGGTEIPADCQLLIIAGPIAPFVPAELDKIDRYLDRGGRLFVLFNFHSVTRPTGLEALLAKYGVEVGQNVVREVDSQYTRTGQDLLVMHYATHEVIKPMYQLGLYMVLPRTVRTLKEVVQSDQTLKVEELAFSSETARVIRDIRPDGSIHPHADDLQGRFSLIVAVEKGRLEGMAAGPGVSRLVVVGESIFLANQALDNMGNRDFVVAALNWLLARDRAVINLPPRKLMSYRLTLSQGQLATARWILMLGLPGAVLLAGAVVMWRRR